MRIARADAGLTISELARRSGVARDTISKVERGENSPNATTLYKLAGALGTTPSALWAAEEQLSPKAPRRSPAEPSFNDVLAEERPEIEIDLAGLFRNLARRAREVAQTVRSPGPYARPGEDAQVLHDDAARLFRIQKLAGAGSDELADAIDDYLEAEHPLQGMIRQDVEAPAEEREEARRFRGGGEDVAGRQEAQRPSIFALALSTVAERWAEITSGAGAGRETTPGIVEAAEDIENLFSVVMGDPEVWSALPTQERSEIVSVMARLGPVTERYHAHTEKRHAAEDRKAMMRKWTREINNRKSA